MWVNSVITDYLTASRNKMDQLFRVLPNRLHAKQYNRKAAVLFDIELMTTYVHTLTQLTWYHFNIIYLCFDYGAMYRDNRNTYLHWFLRRFYELLLFELPYRHCQLKRIDKIIVFANKIPIVMIIDTHTQM